LFSAVNFAIPSLSPILFQIGLTLNSVPDWLCADFCRPPLAAKGEDGLMFRAKTKDLRRTMSRRGLLLVGGSTLLTSFLGRAAVPTAGGAE
jgi:hypothetical protein